MDDLETWVTYLSGPPKNTYNIRDKEIIMDDLQTWVTYLSGPSKTTYNIRLAKKLKSAYAAILLKWLLKEFLVFNAQNILVDHEEHGGGWVLINYDIVTDETGLSQHGIRSAMRILRNEGVVEEKKLYDNQDAKYYKIELPKLQSFFSRTILKE